MRNVIIFAVLALGIAALVPRLYMDGTSRTAARAAVATPEPTGPVASGRSITLSQSDDGHFHADGILDGRHLSFLVDTGASAVALRAKDAGRLGIRPQQRDFTIPVATANGSVRAAPAEISRLEVGGIVVYNVRALVIPDEALSQNLLGMTFLSRIRFEHRRGKLVLEQ